MSEIAGRRRWYLERVLAETDEDALDPYKRPRWALNHARVVLGRDLDRANAYFETIRMDPRPVLWKNGRVDTADWDFLGTLLLKTLLDFRGTDRLGPEAAAHLESLIVGWEQPRPGTNRDNDRVARWPAIHTENHDAMCLVIGLFREVLAGRDASAIERELARYLAWRFQRGWVEWHSPCYQAHWLNPALVLARHAPSERLREGAARLISLQLAERALLSVGGYLGGPYYRGYDRHIGDARGDEYLPVTWMSFGLGDVPRDLDAGTAFAADTFEPHPVVAALAHEAARRPLLDYRGTRCAGFAEGLRPIVYYNTPHVSMGSMQACGYSFQTRFFNVLFPADPSKTLRTYLHDDVEHSPWDKRNERGEVAQHAGWLVSRGSLVAEGGLDAESAGGWDLYRVGRGLCAHRELPGDWHVFQVGDLDQWSDAHAFLAALSEPRIEDGEVCGRTTGGEDVAVSTADLSVSIDGRPREDWTDRMHHCPAMRSAYGSGRIEITSSAGELVLEAGDLAEA